MNKHPYSQKSSLLVEALVAHSRSLSELNHQNRSDNPSITATGKGFATGQAIGAPPAAAGGEDESALGGAVKGAVVGEGLSSLLTAFCWVAAEYYPRGSSDWHRCRNWVLARPRLTQWYMNHGPRLAAEIHNRHWLKELIRPIVKWAHFRGKG